MRILVTGGSGFLGSNLCRFLLEKGHEVICVDDLSSGNKKNIADLIKNKNFSFLKHNVIEPFDNKTKGKIDFICHFASRASPPDYQSDPVHTALTNSMGTNNCAKLALKHNAKILFSSTSEVYGDPEVHPQPESYWGRVNPFGIRSCYDESKRFGEALLLSYHLQHKLKIKIIRIFNTYGPGMKADDGRVVTNFVNQALNNEPLTMFGDGTQTRSFCYVSDLIDGIYAMMNSPDDFIGPVNIGNPYEFTMLELANLVKELTGSNSKIVYRPLPGDDPKQRRPDISLAKKKFGWQPKVQLKEGLKKTIEYFKK